MKADLRILGGLLVEIEFEIEDDCDDSGPVKALCDEWHIASIGGVMCKSPPMWLYRRIAEKRGEFERIEGELLSRWKAVEKDRIQSAEFKAS